VIGGRRGVTRVTSAPRLDAVKAPGRILIVDDEPDLLDVLTDIVGSFGYDISTGINGAEALAIVRMTPPDVVLLDLAMPVMSGREALTHLQADHPEIPIVIVAAQVDAELAQHLKVLGAFGYISKPFEMAEIEQALTAAVTRRRGATLP
jgi:two-component system, OmpR family, response regulator